MIQILKTHAENPDFKRLVILLNADLAKRDGENHPLTQFNEIDSIQNVILAYEGEKLVGCGAIKEYNDIFMEIKRVFVLPSYRGNGIAKKILSNLEEWANEKSYFNFVLVMGLNQPEAQKLYSINAYKITTDFKPLTNLQDTLCMIKVQT